MRTTEDENTLIVSEADIALVRSFPVLWAPVEAGAPAIFEVWKKTPADVTEYRHAMRVAELFIQFAELTPGRYEYDNPLCKAPPELRPLIESNHVEAQGEHVTIDVTENHLKLLRAANTGVRDDGGFDIGVDVHPKRPYGEMACFELDMGPILNIEAEGPPARHCANGRDFSAAQKRMFNELHDQTQSALQAVLLYGTLLPGHYLRRPRDYGRWQRTRTVH